MNEIIALALKLLGTGLDLFAQADGPARLKAWLTKSIGELESIRAGLKPPQ